MMARYKSWIAVSGGLLGAMAASACCVAPLVLLWVGISGAWIANLTALAAYHGYFIAGSFSLLVGGFYFIYVRSEQKCEDGEVCSQPLPGKLIKLSFWFAVIMVSIAAIFPYFVDQYYRGQ